MEKTTPEKIRQGLKSYIHNLYGDQLYDLVKSVKEAQTMDKLPTQLKNSLGLRWFFVSRNLLETIREELLELIPSRCLNGCLISPQHAKWIAKQNRHSLAVDTSTNEKIPQIIREYYDNFYAGQQTTRNSISSFSLSVKQYEKVDNHLLPWELFYIHVQGSNLLLSEVKIEVEKLLVVLNGTVIDVHFVARDCFYVDCSLECENWHGVDILVVARKVHCFPLENCSDYEVKSHLWDVSGVNGISYCPEVAAPGENGQIGNKGQCGGHVLFIADEYVNMKDLVVVSNGGWGSRGQHGGDGIDGEDGKGGAEWSFDEMMMRFPPSVSSDTLRNLVVENVLRTGGVTEFRYQPPSSLDEITGKVIGTVTEFYAKGETSSGVEYQVGFEKGIFQKTAFCLVNGSKGSLGKPGILGGLGGAGGLGGQKGSVTLLYSNDSSSDTNNNNHEKYLNSSEFLRVTAVLKPGRSGRNGMDGKHGQCGRLGKHGKDVGYMSWSGKETLEFPEGRHSLVVGASSELQKGRKQETIYLKILGKHITISGKDILKREAPICPENDEEDSSSTFVIMPEYLNNRLAEVNEKLKRIEKYKLMQTYGRSLSLSEKIPSEDFHSEWWMRKILDI